MDDVACKFACAVTMRSSNGRERQEQASRVLARAHEPRLTKEILLLLGNKKCNNFILEYFFTRSFCLPKEEFYNDSEVTSKKVF